MVPLCGIEFIMRQCVTLVFSSATQITFHMHSESFVSPYMTTDIFFVHLSQKSAYEWIMSSRRDLLHRQDAEKHNEQRDQESLLQ